MTFLLSILVILVSLWIVGGLFANRLTALLLPHVPQRGDEGEQLLLWGGLLLAAFVAGLLVMYVFLQK